MKVDPGGCYVQGGFAPQQGNPNVFTKGLPKLCLGGKHYLSNSGQQTNLLSALLYLSSNAVSYANILLKIVGNKS